MKRLRILMPAILVIAALVGSSQQASANNVHLVATVNGSGRAVMDAASPLKGDTTYFIHVRLYSDGTAIGRFDCVDLPGSDFPGDFSGAITAWTMSAGVLTLSGSGQLNTLSGDLIAAGIPYRVGVQEFGGAGVGHWTLDIPSFGGVLCSELLTSGRLVMAMTGRREDDSD